MKALIFNEKVQEVVADAATFPVHENLSWVDCDASVQTGYSHDAGVFTAPPEDAPVVPPTTDEIYDRTIQNSLLLKAVVLCLNDGTFPIGINFTNAELKTLIKAKM